MQLSRASLVVTLAMAAWCMASTAHAQQNVAAAEREVRETITKFGESYGANDLDTYFSIMADDMTVWWGTRGRNENPTPKKQYMATWPESVKKSGGYESCKLNDLRVQVAPSADAGVASYVLDCIRKNPPAGQKPLISYEMSAVLFKRANGWKVVHWNWRAASPPTVPSSR